MIFVTHDQTEALLDGASESSFFSEGAVLANRHAAGHLSQSALRPPSARASLGQPAIQCFRKPGNRILLLAFRPEDYFTDGRPRSESGKLKGR